MNKASGSDGIPAELFQILKDDAVKLLHSICQQIWKNQWPQDWKRSVFIPIPKKGNAKECSNYCTIVLISHTSKVMFKIPQAKLQHYMNGELPDVQAGFRKGGGTRDQISNIRWHIKKVRVPKKHLFLFYWLPQSLGLCGSQQTGKFLKKPWCWERLRAGGKGDKRGWDGWMASPTQWTWVWMNSGSWWWTGRPSMLQSMGSQRVGHNWATELNWAEPTTYMFCCIKLFHFS